jgi:hypothetical protein
MAVEQEKYPLHDHLAGVQTVVQWVSLDASNPHEVVRVVLLFQPGVGALGIVEGLRGVSALYEPLPLRVQGDVQLAVYVVVRVLACEAHPVLDDVAVNQNSHCLPLSILHLHMFRRPRRESLRCQGRG